VLFRILIVARRRVGLRASQEKAATEGCPTLKYFDLVRGLRTKMRVLEPILERLELKQIIDINNKIDNKIEINFLIKK
jgi:hypothetical protein